MRDKPEISQNSKDILESSGKARKPLYSPERYQQEIENYRLKKEAAVQRKRLED